MEAELRALEKGMQLEKDGRAFYLKAAERTHDPKGRQMYQSLAEDEASHLRILEKQYSAIKAECPLCDFSELTPADAQWDRPLFPQGSALFEKTVSPEASETDALVFALQTENQSVELYRRLAQEATSPEAQEIYRRLASAERGHFNVLMMNYESLSQSGYWPTECPI